MDRLWVKNYLLDPSELERMFMWHPAWSIDAAAVGHELNFHGTILGESEM